MSKEDAIKQATDRASEYQVHGYGRSDDGYGGPYHPDAFKDPQVEFALGGDPEAQEKFTQDLLKLDEAKAKKGPVDKVDLVAASAHSTVVESFPHRALGNDELVVPATHDDVERADERRYPDTKGAVASEAEEATKNRTTPPKKAAAAKKAVAKKTSTAKKTTTRKFTQPKKA